MKSWKSVATPNRFAWDLSYPSARPIFRRALLLLILALSPLLISTRALGQNKEGAQNLFDTSIEDLMAIEIDSVYGASGFKQKVTEAPASVTIITSDEIQKH
ncbi:MAG TPA: hypothetical protein VKV95_14600, partial [Terriglobia bacterium]|nr:hypothetical protein [Terriglobia bacterium]